MMLKIEKTISWQIEGAGETYCATTYSKHDALIVRGLARGIPGLRCLKEGAGGKQPKGIYQYKRDPASGNMYPIVETYDQRLAARVRANLSRLKGDF